MGLLYSLCNKKTPLHIYKNTTIDKVSGSIYQPILLSIPENVEDEKYEKEMVSYQNELLCNPVIPSYSNNIVVIKDDINITNLFFINNCYQPHLLPILNQNDSTLLYRNINGIDLLN